MNAGYYLIQKHGLDPEKVSVVGYAEYRPLVPNTSDDNRSRNRRVDIVILTNVPHEPVNINDDHTSNNNQKRQPQ